MAYDGPGQALQGKFSRRSFMKTTAAGVATGALASGSFLRQAAADDGLRSIGLGVSEINEIQAKATKDLGFPVAGQAMGYGEMFSKMLNQNDQYEIAEGYFNDMRVMAPAKVWQPIDTKKIKEWDKVTNLTKTGKLTPESNEGQGDAPFKLMWCDANGNNVKGPSQYVIMTPALAQCRLPRLQPEGDRPGHRKLGRAAQQGLQGQGGAAQRAADRRDGRGDGDRSAWSQEIRRQRQHDQGRDRLPHRLPDPAQEGRALPRLLGKLRPIGQSDGQRRSGAGEHVVAGRCRDPGRRRALRLCVPQGGHARLARRSGRSPRRSRASNSTKPTSTSTGGSTAGRPRSSRVTATITPFPTTRRSTSHREEWDYWYMGKPAAKDLSDPFGTIIIKKGDVRSGGSYWNRYSKIAVWNSLMDENDYLVKRWTEFLTA